MRKGFWKVVQKRRKGEITTGSSLEKQTVKRESFQCGAEVLVSAVTLPSTPSVLSFTLREDKTYTVLSKHILWNYLPSKGWVMMSLILCFLSCFVISLLFSCSVMWLFSAPQTAAHQASLSPRAYSNLCPLSQWCHPTTSISVSPFSSCPQSFPTSRFFPVSWLFASGSQSIGAPPSASVLKG